MKNLFCLLQSIIVASCLLLSGCIKKPDTDIPAPPEPEWVLTRIVTLVVQGEPEGGPIIYSAAVNEYQYNRQHKPWLYIYSSGPDTNHLQIEGTDTLSYDNQSRPIRRAHAASRSHTVSRYFYSGNSRYPDKQETVVSYSDGGSYTSVKRYTYSDTLVRTIHEYSHIDTLYSVYDKRGDYVGSYSPLWGVTTDYEEYDNAINVGRYLNLDFAEVLNIPEGDEGPLFSAHNWGHFNPYELHRSITYTGGRVSKSYIMYSFPTRHVTSHYYYTLLQ